MAKGLFEASMAPVPEETGAEQPGAPAQMPPEQMGAEGADQSDDPAYDQAIERVTLAAIKVLRQPEIMQQVADALSSPQPAQALGSLAYDITNQLDEKSGATMPEDVLPGAALTVLGLMGELTEAEEGVLIQATQAMLVRLMEESGQDAATIGQTLQQIDVAALVEKAKPSLMGQTEGGEDGEGENEGQAGAMNARDEAEED